MVEPKVLLLDEPLGALDLKLRQQMQIELKELQRSLGITFIFVTHDQEEALTMSDRIGVFNNGKLAQIGTAHEIYQRPTGAFVANFVGTSNLFGADVASTLYQRNEQFVLRPERLTVDWNGTPGQRHGAELPERDRHLPGVCGARNPGAGCAGRRPRRRGPGGQRPAG